MVIGGNKLPQGCTVVPPEKGGCAEIIMGCAQHYAPGTTLVLLVWVVLFSKKTKGCAFLVKNRVVPFFEKNTTTWSCMF